MLFLIPIVFFFQLHPNSVLLLSIFAHLCEMFVGVMPSVALLRHYLYPRVTDANVLLGGLSFHIHDNRAKEYIEQGWKTKVDEWHHRWCFISAGPCTNFEIPFTMAVHDKSWTTKDERDDEFGTAVERIKLLHECGLMARMVATDLLWRCLVAL